MSDLWCQIHADVLDRTIEKVVEPMHAQLRGVAMLAGLALGVVERSEVRELVGGRADLPPDPASRDAYSRQFAEFPASTRREVDLQAAQPPTRSNRAHERAACCR